MSLPVIPIARFLQGIQVLITLLCIFLFVMLIRTSLTLFEPGCSCTESLSKIYHFQDTEIVSYEQCISYPPCQPKTSRAYLGYYFKRYFPYLFWVLAGLISLIITTVGFLRMRNWARLASHIFYLGFSAHLVSKYFADHSVLPIVTYTVLGYTLIFCLVFDNSAVKELFT